ncbi:acetyl-CoA carboxylase biotin carboxyl carrier protein [Citricoccus muralis]|uniref:Biotin carboxyl carrier protein of acetyl-CoA carboxylase n=1 Tax=Citricoccus muralis TaxID=169134 RepID=A0ABY8H457_9MICC|nr:acetyl-CoA carboxylase biotin carboxyl carrier protein [Citricoccus muralis]WFP15919.1 acetyl-CoA carboxylase biotin carboxyl carrier protein [Citricoccus muralis]
MAEITTPTWDELVKLVAELDGSNFENVSIDYGEVSLRMSRDELQPDAPARNRAETPTPAPADPAPVPTSNAAAAAPSAHDTETASAASEGTAVSSPMVGVFYRSPSPDAPPFVTEGDRVEADSTVGIIEVMKLMNPVQAGVAGVVSSFAAADAQAVEYGQDLLHIIPETS